MIPRYKVKYYWRESFNEIKTKVILTSRKTTLGSSKVHVVENLNVQKGSAE